MKTSCDYNPNIPVGAIGHVTPITPIMREFEKYSNQGLECSVVYNNLNVPEGALEHFKKYGYVVIKNICNPNDLKTKIEKSSGRIIYNKSLDQFYRGEADPQVPNSFSRYLYPPYKEYHNKIRFILEDILSEKLYNTYYFDRIYHAGDSLLRHVDRESCEISISVQIGSNIKEPWPICINTLDGKEISINLENGWGILYMGNIVSHWRDTLKSKNGVVKSKILNALKIQDNTYFHQVFFHYVRQNGYFAHHAFDRDVR